MSNNTPPKEIWVDRMGFTSTYPYDALIQAKARDMMQTKYLSEMAVNEMLTEKDEEIEKLKKDENLESIISEIEYIKGLYDNKRYTNAELSFQKLTEQIKDYIGL